MEERQMATFRIGDPVVIVTNRELQGYVTGLDIPHFGTIDFASQSFKGQKGWISALSLPVEGGDPKDYEVGFRLGGNPRTVILHQFERQGLERGRLLEARRQVEYGRGFVKHLRAEDLAPDPAPEGNFDQFQDERYEAGEFDLNPAEALLAEVYVRGSSILPLGAPEVPITACSLPVFWKNR
jgi:hypothetical protein